MTLPAVTSVSYTHLDVYKRQVKGEAEMDYRIIKQEAFRIVGVREPLLPDFEDSFRRVPEFWGEAAASGAIPRLCLLMDAAPKGILGVSTCMPDAENYYYIAVASTRPAPEGMHEYVVPACTWAVFPGRGSMPAAMQDVYKRQQYPLSENRIFLQRPGLKAMPFAFLRPACTRRTFLLPGRRPDSIPSMPVRSLCPCFPRRPTDSRYSNSCLPAPASMRFQEGRIR